MINYFRTKFPLKKQEILITIMQNTFHPKKSLPVNFITHTEVRIHFLSNFFQIGH